MTSGRNAVPPYAMHGKVELRVVAAPIRTGALRSLAAAPNVFAIESAIDELARAAKTDPLELRLKLAGDVRLRRVLERVAEMSGWGTKPNLGISCAEYHDSWGAEVVEVELAPSGKVRVLRVWCAVDCGRVINPDGAKNQIEGGIVQALSWTLIEELRHKNGRVLPGGLDAYPIATFRDAPRSIEVAFVDDGTHAPTGVGEMGAVPLAGAVANAVVAAGGMRVRRLPLTPARVRP
jgi:CO/xanthine dehydrogenase Mo-binding subunit